MAPSNVPPDLVALTEFLETDSRPTAILEVDAQKTGVSIRSGIIYENSAFKRLELGLSLFNDLLKQLATDSADGSNSRDSPTTLFKGKLWNLNLTAGEYQILTCRGRSQETADNESSSLDVVESPDSGIGLEKSSSGSNIVAEADHSINWVRFRIAGLSPWIDFIRNFDWASTPLGPIEEWPESLRGYVLHIMSNPSPRLICWGSSMTIIYNEACIPLFGEKHPSSCLGGSAPVVWADAWDEIGHLLESTYQGNVTKHEKMHLPMRRNEILEDTFWNCISLPVSGIHGDIIGLFLEFTEMTRLIIGERRRDTMMKLSQKVRSAESIDALFSCFLSGLEVATADMPFALLYRVQHGGSDSASDSSGSSPKLMQSVFEGALGVPQDDEGICRTFKLSDNEDVNHGLVKACLEAWNTRKPITVHREDEDFSTILPKAALARPVDDQIKTFIVSPITTIAAGEVLGILVMAVNPKIPLDEDYKLFFNVIPDILIRATSLISLPQEQRRAQKIADEMNNTLAQQLRLVTLQAERMEAKFSRMAAEAPTGMFVYDREGRPLYVNDAYLKVLGETKEEHAARSSIAMAWSEHVHPEDMPKFQQAWRDVLEHKSPLTLEYRLKKPWTSIDQASGHEITGERWLLANAFPDVDSDGKISSIQGWLTDISHRKFSERLLSQKLEDALENKRQTENFIDMTSHEMRNPLSAIVQSADSIVSMLDHPGESIAITREAVEEIQDAAETIILCAQHQKRIVDDILTLSKLDASLLHISPDKVQPPSLLAKALKMYEAEINRAGITAQVEIEPTYDQLSVDWVIIDPSRLLQVIINLITNAIKFTQYAVKRHITIYLGASYQRPTGQHHKVSFIPAKDSRRLSAAHNELGDGEELYLQIAVSDTGSGMNEEEMRMLFQRFHQASPQTYSKYGGSGLGLFISRELCELQGGQIGVSSGDGKTTFTFFVRAKRWVPDVPEKVSRPMLPRFISASASPVMFKRNGSFALEDTGSAPLSRVGSIAEEGQARAGDDLTNGPAVQLDSPKPLDEPKQLHVLIVEDNLLNQKVATNQLRKAGCIVHVANHGLECLTFLEKTVYYTAATTPLSIILLDLQMPTMDGLTCIKHIRERQESGVINGHIPVIAVTANARPEQVSSALDAGMDQVVTKPFRIAELMPQMHALVTEIAERDAFG